MPSHYYVKITYFIFFIFFFQFQVYTNVFLTILLRIQVNILGAYLYQANQNPSNPELELCPEAQSKFLSASNFFLTTGIEQFCLVQPTL